jgi:hypothetical protein
MAASHNGAVKIVSANRSTLLLQRTSTKFPALHNIKREERKGNNGRKYRDKQHPIGCCFERRPIVKNCRKGLKADVSHLLATPCHG